MPSFLYDVCDFHLNYAGCENVGSMLLVNLIFLCFYAVTCLLSFVFPLEKIYSIWRQKKPWKQLFSTHTKICVFMGLAYLSKVIVYIRLQQGTALPPDSADQLVATVITVILFESFFSIFSGVAYVIYNDWLVYSFCYSVDSNIISSTTLPRWSYMCHRVVLVLITIFYACFITLGLHGSLDDYIIWRRVVYLFIGAVQLTFVPLIVYTSGLKPVDQWLKQQKGTRAKAVTKKVLNVRRAMRDYLMNCIFGGINCVMIVVMNETYAANPSILLVAKIALTVMMIPNHFLPPLSYAIPSVLKMMGRTHAKAEPQPEQSPAGGQTVSRLNPGSQRANTFTIKDVLAPQTKYPATVIKDIGRLE
ncbi:hypothetical protein HDU91_005625 [Kappamyces sp. JEL0680]|nr:hypothetical protein HDU91_005625 [Kappamyces sp. JEL0680]